MASQGRDRRGRRRVFKLTKKIDPPGFQTRHLVLYGSARHACLDRFDHSAYLTFGLFQVSRGSVATSILFGPLPVHFPVELVDEGRDQFRVH